MELPPKERELLYLIGEVHNKFIELEKESPEHSHPSDIGHWADAVHRMQSIVGLRVLRKKMPSWFTSNETLKNGKRSKRKN